MIKQLPVLFISALLLASCGGGSSSTTTNPTTNTPDENNDTEDVITPDEDNVSDSEDTTSTGELTFICSATAATEAAFSDTFVENNGANIEWISPAIYELTSVEQIAEKFNTARASDPTIKQKLLMPTQADWDVMSSSEKGLFLVNSERCARGLEPFEGIAPELVTSSSSYAEELSDSGEFSHNYGLYEDPVARLEGYAGVTVNTNADFLSQAENLARHTVLSTGDYSPIYEPTARAIYSYMYNDYMYDEIGSSYGHRTLILIKTDNENSGDAGSEGLFGLSKTIRDYMDDGTFTTVSTSVMHVFDPNENWDMSNVEASPSIFGPETETDCLSGTFMASTDTDGNNTSYCN